MTELHDTKVSVPTTEESEKVQKLLFKLGFGWGAKKDKQIKYMKSKFIYIYKDGTIRHGGSEGHFNEHENTMISIVDILALDPDNRPSNGDYLEPIIT